MSTSLHGADALNMARSILGRELTPQEAQIVSSEGFNAGTYKDTNKQVPTTGFGQTGEFANIPFDQVVNTFEERTRGLVPEYNNLPQALQLRLLDSTYRGGISGSPKTLEYVNAGNWNVAADEFLDNKEYRKAKEAGSGVAGRMEETAQAMRDYGSQLAAQKVQAQAVPPQAQAVAIPQATVATTEAPPQVDAGFLSPVDDFINSWFGGNQSGKPKKEVTELIPKGTKETAKSIWDTLFGD